jgi:outer membrane protein assembly factor BamB
VVGGFGSGDLLALRADSGTVAWADSLASARGRNSLTDLSAIRALPVISGGRVYAIGLGGLMLALDLRSGRRLWERDMAGGDTPWLAGDWIFLITADQQLVAMSAADGRVRWTADLPRYPNPKNTRNPIFWRGPILAGDRLLVCGSTGRMIAADPQTGHTLAEQKLPDAASLAPVAANGLTYVVTDDGSLSAFR